MLIESRSNFFTSHYILYFQRIPVDELVTDDICNELEKRGFKKDVIPSPPDINDEF